MKIFFHEDNSLHLARKIADCSQKWRVLENLQSVYMREENLIPLITMPTDRHLLDRNACLGQANFQFVDELGLEAGHGVLPIVLQLLIPSLQSPLFSRKNWEGLVFAGALAPALFTGIDLEKIRQRICRSHIKPPLQSIIRSLLFMSLRKDTQDTGMLAFRSNQSWPVQGSCSLIKPAQKLMLLN